MHTGLQHAVVHREWIKKHVITTANIVTTSDYGAEDQRLVATPNYENKNLDWVLLEASLNPPQSHKTLGVYTTRGLANVQPDTPLQTTVRDSIINVQQNCAYSKKKKKKINKGQR